MKKFRLDKLLVDRGFFASRELAQSFIMQGKVIVGNTKCMKAGQAVDEAAEIRILEPETFYVSRGGDKLAGAYDKFAFDIKDRICLDVGVSTGGFTDFLLRRGARFVFGVDVGYGQADLRIRNSSSVCLLERVNARFLTPDSFAGLVTRHCADALPFLSEISLVVMDVSFISVLKVLPAVKTLVRTDGEFIVLIKPQFEGKREQIGKGGVVRDEANRVAILHHVRSELSGLGFVVTDECDSPVQGAKGNKEAFFRLRIGQE